ncbi:MAG: extracellular solute-binding protein, partial [Firmicutes bacterium]|nr:extracellular solute-binding protein [Bacillota bacterium]
MHASKSPVASAGRVGRLVVALTALSLALALGAPLAASAAPVPVRFYYPVQVAGPLARVIDGLVEEFNRTHPDIVVIPVYSGNYDETMQKAQTAALSGNPPDVAVLLA